MSEKAKLSNVLAHAHYAASFDAESEEEVYDPKKEGLVRSLLQELGEESAAGRVAADAAPGGQGTGFPHQRL